MRIRSEMFMRPDIADRDSDRPLFFDELPQTAAPELNPDLYSPPGAAQLAIVREHCIKNPHGILLDTYQAVTELELKYPSGSPKALRRYMNGVKEEARELVGELWRAQVEHPYHEIINNFEGPESSWLATVLDETRLRFIDIKSERKKKILGELGDVIWYGSRLAAESGVSLSAAFIAYMRHAKAGKLVEYFDQGFGEEIIEWAGNNLDLKLVQDISLSQKFASWIRVEEGTPRARRLTVDSAPSAILARVIDEDLHFQGGIPENIDIIIGKLVWFASYISSSVLNADFATIIQANLEKNVNRTKNGTTFNKEDRTAQDESSIGASRNPRVPLGYIVESPTF